jgi:hypothetical protein
MSDMRRSPKLEEQDDFPPTTKNYNLIRITLGYPTTRASEQSTLHRLNLFFFSSLSFLYLGCSYALSGVTVYLPSIALV